MDVTGVVMMVPAVAIVVAVYLLFGIGGLAWFGLGLGLSLIPLAVRR